MLIPVAGIGRSGRSRIRQIDHRPINAQHPPALPPLHAPFRRIERIELLYNKRVEVAK